MNLESVLSLPNILYILFFLAFLCFWVFIYLIFYHLTRFGIGTLPKKYAIAYLFGSILLFFMSVLFFMTIDLRSLQGQLAELTKSAN